MIDAVNLDIGDIEDNELKFLTAYWRMNESSGTTLADVSGNSKFNLTLTNTAWSPDKLTSG